MMVEHLLLALFWITIDLFAIAAMQRIKAPKTIKIIALIILVVFSLTSKEALAMLYMALWLNHMFFKDIK